MTEPTIVCPNCRSEIKLTESLAAPLIESTRRQFELRIAQKDEEIARRETAVRDQQAAVARARETIDEQVAARLKTERGAIAAAEEKKAREAVSDEIARVQREKAATVELLQQRDARLAEAQKKELDLLRQKRELEDARRELELSVERRLQEQSAKLREEAAKQSDEQNRLKIAEKDKTITDLQARLQEAIRKAEQGSQQLQGEVQELELEAILRARFPLDTIEPVPKGEHGGDVLHRVLGPGGQACGTILWESKRTRNWSDGWLAKLRDDQRAAKAEIAVIVSQALPKGVDTFDLVEGVWVTHPRAALPVALAVRQLLVDVSSARQTGEGRQTKMELVYQYLTGSRFRQRVEAIVEAFSTMQEDLDKERRVILKQWDKRREQIDRVMQATAGMYGDLQGIAGKSLLEVDGLEPRLLGDGNDAAPAGA